MDALDARLQSKFGIEAFRPWQREVVDALLTGSGSVLAVAPTGGGKSLCYQFPATELEGTSIVVCPLIALMEDQVRGLLARGIPATYLASNLDADERRKRERDVREGRVRIVYVAPERLASRGQVLELARLKPPLVAVDEAHCISQWGHDFRPDYLRLGEVIAELAPPRVLACTATATPSVRAEILERLALPPDTTVVLRGFARANLHLCAEELDGPKDRKRTVVHAVREALGAPSAPKGGAIVYCATRKSAEEWAHTFAAERYRTAAYHAGLDPETRATVSAKFAERRLDVVCATNAFGMGIDRPDVRVVAHTAPPGSIEGYYQEVGRAGRDGQPALGLLVATPADVALRRRLVERPSLDGAAPDPKYVERQWKMFLDLMRYVEAGSCRHDFILRYFGDEQELLGGCGHCDVCERLEERGGSERVVSEDDALMVRKALAGVARAKQRAGLGAIAEMLVGEKSPKVLRWSMQELTTFGILKMRSKAWVTTMLRRLVTAGLVDLTPNEYPVPYLTKLGIETMKGGVPVRVLVPENTGPKPARREPKVAKEKPWREQAAPAGFDDQMFEKLRQKRAELARGMGIPAYVVAHDRTLVDMAVKKPRTRAEMTSVHGMGPARIEAYGDAFASVIQG